jgi:hypothetical protein
MTAGPGQDNFGYINDESSNADRTNSQQNNVSYGIFMVNYLVFMWKFQEKIDKNERQNWGKSIEFLFSCIAMSVGLGNHQINLLFDFLNLEYNLFIGNIWRFPLAALKNGMIFFYMILKPKYIIFTY